jgi:hypothetical protein
MVRSSGRKDLRSRLALADSSVGGIHLSEIGDPHSRKVKLWDNIGRGFTSEIEYEGASQSQLRKYVYKCTLCDYVGGSVIIVQTGVLSEDQKPLQSFDAMLKMHLDIVSAQVEEHEDAEIAQRDRPISTGATDMRYGCSGCGAVFRRRRHAQNHLSDILAAGAIHLEQQARMSLVKQFSLDGPLENGIPFESDSAPPKSGMRPLRVLSYKKVPV